MCRPGCGVCFELFDEGQRVPMVIAPCGHTLCHACMNRLRPVPAADGESFDDYDLVVCPTCRQSFHRISDTSRLFLHFPQPSADIADLSAEERGVLASYAVCENDSDMLQNLAAMEYRNGASDRYMFDADLVVLICYASKHKNDRMMRAIMERGTRNDDPPAALINALVRIIHETDYFTSFVWYFSKVCIDNKLFFGHACVQGDWRVVDTLVFSYANLTREQPVHAYFTYDYALAWHALLARPADAECIRVLVQRGAQADAACTALVREGNLALRDVSSLAELLRLGCTVDSFDVALNLVVDLVAPSSIDDVTDTLQRLCRIVRQQPCGRSVAAWDDLLVRLLMRIRGVRVRSLGTMRTAKSWTSQRWDGVQHIMRCCDILETGFAQTLWHIRGVFS